jgi:hypothetical protein
MSKKDQRLSVDYKTEEMLVVFSVLNAEDKVIATQSFDFNDVHESLTDRVSLYGLNKLLTDRTSEQKDKVVKLEAMAGVMDQLAAGDWAKERTVGAVVVSVFVEALAKFK